MDLALKAGVHYPVSTGEMMAWFGTDADRLDYLEWLRWPRCSPSKAPCTKSGCGRASPKPRSLDWGDADSEATARFHRNPSP